MSTIMNGFRSTFTTNHDDNEPADNSSEDEEVDDDDENTEVREMMLDILAYNQLTDTEYESD